MRSKRSFTLLEWMIAISLLLIASGLTGSKMRDALVKRKFRSDLDRLRSRCLVCQRLAASTQTDWSGVLRKEKKGWSFEVRCGDSSRMGRFAPLKIEIGSILLNGKKVEEIPVDFFASGKIHPEGKLLFLGEKNALKEEWNVPQIFFAEEGEKLGPLHPDEIN